jgi:hypothetical protein
VNESAGEELRVRNRAVQTAAAEFLQFLLAKITAPKHARAVARNVRATVLQCLAGSVSGGSLVLQVHLLGVLRAVVVYSSAVLSGDDDDETATGDGDDARRRRDTSTSGGASKTGGSSSTADAAQAAHDAADDAAASGMLLQTLIVGLLQPPLKNIRYHWLEFITASLPYLGDSLRDIVVPVVRCMCGLIDS